MGGIFLHHWILPIQGHSLLTQSAAGFNCHFDKGGTRRVCDIRGGIENDPRHFQLFLPKICFCDGSPGSLEFPPPGPEWGCS